MVGQSWDHDNGGFAKRTFTVLTLRTEGHATTVLTIGSARRS
jgi:hypothetical protein